MKNTLLVIALAAMAFACKKESHPQASFKTDKGAYYLTQTVTFTNTSTGMGPYTWNFGDNGISTEKNPTHVYASAGTYKAKLIIGGSVSSKTIKVYPGTAGYVLYNNTHIDSVHFFTFFQEKDSTNVQDITDHGSLNTQEKSDTAFTPRAALYLKLQIGTNWFAVVSPYTLIRFSTKIMEINNDTQVVLNPSPAATRINPALSPALHIAYRQVSLGTLKAYLNKKTIIN